MRQKFWTFHYFSDKDTSCKRVTLSSKTLMFLFFLLLISSGGYIRAGYFFVYRLIESAHYNYERQIHGELLEKERFSSLWLKKLIWTLEFDEKVLEILDPRHTPHTGRIIPVHKTGPINPEALLKYQAYNKEKLFPDPFPNDFRDTISISISSEKSPFVPSIPPTSGDITSFFGQRTDPVYEGTAFHRGIDIASYTGTEIRSSAQGVVIFSGFKNRYGNMIIIDHLESGYKTLYAHLYRSLVSVGDSVKKNGRIALMGSTGKSTGPHLHYEVHFHDKAVDPLEYMIPKYVIVD